ncbi:MAG: hypothetical protein PEPC_01034 [Peptostreptococcus russellii]
MMKKSKKVILILLIIFQLMNLIGFQSFSIEKDSDGVTLVTEDNTYKKTKFYKPNLFGIAGGFHLVGFNSIHTGSHVNGNILTKTLNYGSNFGTKGVEEISYIQDRINGVQGFQGTADTRSVIVVGKNINTGVADNGNAWSINGSKIDKPEKRANLNSLWKDSSSKFIDIDLLEKEMIDLSRTLSNHKNNAIYIENSDHNRQTIRIENSEVFNVYNLKNGDFNFSNDINIYGFDKSKPTTLVINVDMKEFGSTFSLKKSIAHYTDGSTAPTGEVKTWQNANVVWNIYDSSQPDGVFNGYITNNDTITGILLSPGADANMTKNFNGTIIAKNITNSGETHRDDYVPTNTEIAVSKVWEGKAKEEVEVSLLADGKEIDKITLNDKNDWKHIFKDLPIVDENTNKKINYTVKEKKIEGYESNIEKNGNGFVITNIENKLVKLKEIPVKKVWQGKAKEEVEVSLLADGKEVDKISLNDKNSWKHIFKKLPAVDKETNKEINYTVKEKKVDGYESKIEKSKTGFVITNMEEKEIEVEKVWQGKAKEEVEVSLLADGKEVDKISLNDKNSWKHIFKNLPAIDKETNKEINYTVKEKKIEGYESKIEKSKTGFVITNTENKSPKLKEIPVEKVWVGTPKDEIEVSLLADGKEVEKVILNKENNWKYIFKDLSSLDKETGKEIIYSVKEKIIEGYESSISEKGNGFVITNTEKESPKLKEIPVEKVWVGIPKDEIEVSLLADGKEVEKVILNKENNWKYIFKDLSSLDKETGKEIIYSVKEKIIEGYESSISEKGNGFVITNTEKESPKLKEIPVRKVWKGRAKEEVEISLLADGKEVEKIILNKDNNWKHVFKNLPIRDKETDKEINYTIREKRVSGYRTEIKKEKDGFVVINTKRTSTSKSKNIPVKKIWKGKAKDKVEIALLADGKEVGKVTLNSENDWEHIFRDLPIENRSTGREIKYTVKEKEISGYDSEIKEISDGFIVINTESKLPKLTQVPVKKIWYGKVQNRVEISLFADGKKVDEVILNNKNDWEHTFKNLPTKNEDTGKEIKYTVKEKEISGYDSEIKEVLDGFIITNTENGKPKLTQIPVAKVWNGKAQSQVEIRLLADGKEVDNVILNNKNKWIHIFEGLPLENDTGKEIKYTVSEKEVVGYKSDIRMVRGAFIVTNTELDENEKKTTNANNISNIKTSNPKTYDKGILSSIIILIFATIGMIFILKIKKDK